MIVLGRGYAESMAIPADVFDYVRGVFLQANREVTNTLSNQPGMSEPALDLALIASLQSHATPHRVGSGWIVRILVHYLGGMRHWGRWEIADIGLLLFVKERSGTTKKVALLQSKRLYPKSGVVNLDVRLDYEIGFARLADPEMEHVPIGLEGTYRFTEDCRYAEIVADSPQMQAIDDHTLKNRIPTYYCLYHPWKLPFTMTVPITKHRRRRGAPSVGVRISPAPEVHAAVRAATAGRSPSVKDLAESGATTWALEHFVADELLACRQGARFNSVNDEKMQTLFYRRSGPIAAALSVWIEEPGVTG